jgi:hypothetical protein
VRVITPAIVILFCVTSFATLECNAAKLLRWKLQPGQQFQVQVAQNSKTKTTVNDRTVKMSLDMLMDMKWTVDSVDQMGVATISQMFTRMRVDMDAPSVGKVSFDTAKETKPGELTEGLSDALDALIPRPAKEGEPQRETPTFSVLVNPRGEIVKVDIPKETAAAIKKATASSKLRHLLSVDGLTQLLQQSLATLPDEAIDPDHQWSLETTTPSPLGVLKQTHKYTYRGAVQRNGQPVDQIDVVTELSLEPSKDAAAKKLKIKSHKQSGSLFFDAEEGRFVATDIQQTLVSETPFRDLRIIVSVETTSQTEISTVESPANDKSD